LTPEELCASDWACLTLADFTRSSKKEEKKKVREYHTHIFAHVRTAHTAHICKIYARECSEGHTQTLIQLSKIDSKSKAYFLIFNFNITKQNIKL
jgi:hypothetical protein